MIYIITHYIIVCTIFQKTISLHFLYEIIIVLYSRIENLFYENNVVNYYKKKKKKMNVYHWNCIELIFLFFKVIVIIFANILSKKYILDTFSFAKCLAQKPFVFMSQEVKIPWVWDRTSGHSPTNGTQTQHWLVYWPKHTHTDPKHRNYKSIYLLVNVEKKKKVPNSYSEEYSYDGHWLLQCEHTMPWDIR